MSDGDYKYTTTTPVSSRDDYRMRLFVETYLRSFNLNGTNPETAADKAVMAFDDQFPEAVVKGDQ